MTVSFKDCGAMPLKHSPGCAYAEMACIESQPT